MRANHRSVYLFIVAFLFSACASTEPTKSSSPFKPTPPASITLSMPGGWDDSIIDKIKEGESLKKRIAVLDFEGNEKLEGKVDLKLSDMLITSLAQTGKFDLIERTKIDNVINEQKLGMSGLIDESTAAEMGRILGAEYVVFGTITSATQQSFDKFGYELVVIEVVIDVRAVDTNTGKILLAERSVGKSENKIIKSSQGTVVSGAIDYNSAYASAARKSIDNIGMKIGHLYPLLGYVVMTDGNQITLDMGEDRGVRLQNVFIVFRIGEEILHPVTGKHIGWSKEVLASIIIETTEKSLSTGKYLKWKSPDMPVKPGDLVISAN